jgi:hypothetical protein
MRRRLSPWWLAALYGLVVFLGMVAYFYTVAEEPRVPSLPLRTTPPTAQP